ncbi:unnamed protein product [Sphagnum troendelagicum]
MRELALIISPLTQPVSIQSWKAAMQISGAWNLSTPGPEAGQQSEGCQPSSPPSLPSPSVSLVSTHFLMELPSSSFTPKVSSSFAQSKGAAVVSSFMHFFYSSLSLSLQPVTPDISDATAPADAIPIFCHLQL